MARHLAAGALVAGGLRLGPREAFQATARAPAPAPVPRRREALVRRGGPGR
jgi:hypothetical protein